jgi:hypothetical protein
MNTILQACLIVMCSVGLLQGEDPADALQIKAPEKWKGETITLPAAFAPDMKFKGIEVIKFAPGMFDAKADSFFSYVLVFQVEPKQELTQKVLRQELLAYYRGLATSVLKNQKVEFDPKSFALKLKEAKATAAARPTGAKTFKGDLKWLEPFVTRKPQTLHLEIEAWKDVKSKHNYIFICASPSKTTGAIWNEMRGIRKSFYQSRIDEP